MRRGVCVVYVCMCVGRYVSACMVFLCVGVCVCVCVCVIDVCVCVCVRDAPSPKGKAICPFCVPYTTVATTSPLFGEGQLFRLICISS